MAEAQVLRVQWYYTKASGEKASAATKALYPAAAADVVPLCPGDSAACERALVGAGVSAERAPAQAAANAFADTLEGHLTGGADAFDARTWASVRSGMWDACVPARALRSAYGVQDEHRLLRGTWYVEAKKGDWRPLREDAANRIEAAFNERQAGGGAGEARVELDGAHALLRGSGAGDAWLVLPVAYLSSEGMTITMGALSGLMSRKSSTAASSSGGAQQGGAAGAGGGGGGAEGQGAGAGDAGAPPSPGRPTGGMRLRRGALALPPPERGSALAHDEAYRDAPPSRVALVVHGIGQAGFGTIGEFDVTYNCTDLTATCEAVAGDSKRAGAAKEGDSAPDDRVRAFPLLPVQWRKNLTMPPDVMLQKAMPTCSAFAQKLRRSAQLTVTDVLYYMAPQYRPVILDSLVKALHGVAARFYRRNPAFAGSVNVIGHSLGTVLMYDLLSNQPVAGEPARPMTAPKLRLEVHDLVMTGSPLAVFLSLRGAYLCDDREGFAGERRPQCARVYNIMHPFDPVAYRIEPLVGEDLCDWAPVKIGNYQTGDLLLHHKLAEMSKGASSAWVRAASKVTGVVSAAARMVPGSKGRAVAALAAEAAATHGVEAEARAAASAPVREAALTTRSVEVLQSLSGAPLPHGRLDFQLQEGMVDSAVVGAVTAHFCYWSNADLALFLLQNIGQDYV